MPLFQTHHPYSRKKMKWADLNIVVVRRDCQEIFPDFHTGEEFFRADPGALVSVLPLWLEMESMKNEYLKNQLTDMISPVDTKFAILIDYKVG